MDASQFSSYVQFISHHIIIELVARSSTKTRNVIAHCCVRTRASTSLWTTRRHRANTAWAHSFSAHNSMRAVHTVQYAVCWWCDLRHHSLNFSFGRDSCFRFRFRSVLGWQANATFWLHHWTNETLSAAIDCRIHLIHYICVRSSQNCHYIFSSNGFRVHFMRRRCDGNRVPAFDVP